MWLNEVLVLFLFQFGLVAWLLSTVVGLFLAFLRSG